MKSPVLFLIFNRPETTRQVFESIRAARPPRLYVAADGPRPNREGEAELCAEVRRMATAIDWPCDIKTLFREENLGCRRAVSEGISWFFEQEEEGIIIEDDVHPVSSFFIFCDELLERYRTDDRVGTICGTNLVSGSNPPENGYSFSRYSSVWGWASWRRVWKHYDVDMKTWPKRRDGGELSKLFRHNRCVESYFKFYFNQTHSGKINTWDYQLSFLCFRLGMLSAVPSCNQIRNLGLAIEGAHSQAGSPIPGFILNSPPQLLKFPLVHPASMAPDNLMDGMIDLNAHNLPRFHAFKRQVRSLPWVGQFLGTAWDHIKGRNPRAS